MSGKRMREAPGDFRLKSIFPSLEIYEDWVEGEKNVSQVYRKEFSRMERLILYCRVACGWGRRTITKKLGLSEFAVREFYTKMKAWR